MTGNIKFAITVDRNSIISETTLQHVSERTPPPVWIITIERYRIVSTIFRANLFLDRFENKEFIDMEHLRTRYGVRVAGMAETGLVTLAGRGGVRRILDRLRGSRTGRKVGHAVDPDALDRAEIERRTATATDRRAATIETIDAMVEMIRARLERLTRIIADVGDHVDLEDLVVIAGRLRGTAAFLAGRESDIVVDRDAAAAAVHRLDIAVASADAERADRERLELRRRIDAADREIAALRTAYAISRQTADDARMMIAAMIETDSRYDQPSASLVGECMTRSAHDGAGWSTLRDVARLSAKELLQVHGIGQQRLQRLRDHFTAQGMPCLFAVLPWAETLQHAARDGGPIVLHAMPTVLEHERAGDILRLPLMVGPDVSITVE